MFSVNVSENYVDNVLQSYMYFWGRTHITLSIYILSFPVAQLVEHGVSNAKIMGSIPRESKSW